VSYFFSLSATESNATSFLAGDRNLSLGGAPVPAGQMSLTADQEIGWTQEMHNEEGHVLLGDGSVQRFSESRLWQAVRQSDLKTNLLMIP
jgi:hypothetical protein